MLGRALAFSLGILAQALLYLVPFWQTLRVSSVEVFLALLG
jgi:hypothetical protein